MDTKWPQAPGFAAEQHDPIARKLMILLTQNGGPCAIRTHDQLVKRLLLDLYVSDN